MKAFRIIIAILLIAFAVGLMCYQHFVKQELDGTDALKAALIILGAISSLFRKPKQAVGNKKTLYQKAYGEFIQNAFSDQPKLEKRFYTAVHYYNRNKPSSAVAILEKLRKECQRTNDIWAVTVFMALCLDDMGLYEQALEQYEAAVRIRGNSTLHSNKALCLQRLGRLEEAENAYYKAIESDPKNEYAYNNLSSLLFRQEDYEGALEYAEQAIGINPKMRQALSTAAMCCALLGFSDQYEHYYRQAVANGADGSTMKKLIKDLDPTL